MLEQNRKRCAVAGRAWGILMMCATLPSVSFNSLAANSAGSRLAGPVATRAQCGANDKPETGIQGRTTLEDRFAPGGPREFTCNLSLLGRATGEGASWGFATTDKCAYFTQRVPPELPPVLEDPGVAVVDVSDSSNPKIAKFLKSPAMLDGNETPQVHLGRKLLIAQAADQLNIYGKTIDIYDISDCLNPVLKFSGVIPGVLLHYGDFTHDGMTYFGSPGPDKSDTVSALDVSDPSHPKVIAQWKPENPEVTRIHGLSVSDDAKSLYITVGRHFPMEKSSEPAQGMAVVDVSEVTARKADPRMRMIGEPLYWSDNDHNQYIRPLTIKGRKYVWENNFAGAIPNPTGLTGRKFVGPLASRDDTPTYSAEEGCRKHKGRPGWGYVNIINVDDPSSLQRVSGLRLEIHEPENCLEIAKDPVFAVNGYSPANCDVDNHQDARMMVCGFGESGLRVFDIRDVKKPREIAYYKPPGVGTAPRRGSPYQTFRDTGITWGPTKYHSADGVTNPRFANNGREVWFVSLDNGFQAVRFSDELIAREKGIFDRDITCGGGLRGPHGCH